jgi:uncharacterized protein DUF6894
MSRFYFHIRFGDQIVIDHEGSDLPDPAAAREEALVSARQILADAIRSGNETIPEAFVIADSEGHELETVRFAAALPKRLKCWARGIEHDEAYLQDRSGAALSAKAWFSAFPGLRYRNGPLS